uniref:Uncharacterized protein n=1 Tax=Xiphophorus couchianus TaxID=32473 RepID=A0A3B5M110_9TELE
MAVLHRLLSQLFSWSGISFLLQLMGTALLAVVGVWTARLLVRHAWYTHRLSCFHKPRTHSWLIGHLGQVSTPAPGSSGLSTTWSESFILTM